jgi:aspartokinase/homoserine dehydrogenase 1
VALDFEAFERHVNADHMPHAVIVDCTASADVAARYAGWLERGIHVITPNKKAFSGDYDEYVRLREQSEHGSTHYFYETTVGAALPIITTLRDLIDTGDEVYSIQGILSGTLAYLFNVYDGSKPFSEIVRAARKSGYTEPDPRDDLSGMDVARKLTILARELGQPLSIGDFPVQDLVPEALRDVGVDEFLDRLADYDDDIAERYAAAASNGQKLRYIARLDAAGNAAVALEAVDASHPFSNINLTDNVVQFQTARYSENPLVVQGPGAGPEVTAAGVFSDLLRLANYVDPGH